VSGKEKLREAICEYTRRQDAVSYQPRQVCVTCGAKDAIHLTLAALIDPGDEVIVPVPYWVSYPEQARLVGGTPVFVPGDKSRGGKIDPERLRAAITPRTRVFILNTPSNPAGFAYSHSEVEAIADVLRPTAVLIISDEIYNRLYFRDEPPLSFAALPGMYDRTITINGASKAFAMTGWRLGYAAGPEPIIAAAARIQSQTTNGPASFVQSAMIAALTGDQACVDRMRCTYRRRAEVMYAALNRLESVHCVEPEGAFYAFPDVSGTFERLGVRDAAGFCAAALEHAHIALVPGNAFGWDTHVRFSYATGDRAIEEGLRRFSAWLTDPTKSQAP
jgi:aspartate aminotransferase